MKNFFEKIKNIESETLDIVMRLIVLFLTALILTLIMSQIVFDIHRLNNLNAGEVAKHTVVAPHTFTFNYNSSEYEVKRGEVVIRAGDVINTIQQEKLREIKKIQTGAGHLQTAVGFFLLTSFLLFLTYLFAVNIFPTFRPSVHDLLLISVALYFSFLLVRINSILGDSLSLAFPDVSPKSFILATPFAAGGILLQVTLGAPSVLIFTVAFGLLSGVFLDDSWLVLLLIFLGNIVGALSVKRCSRRSAFLAAGARVAIVDAFIVVCLMLISPHLSATGASLYLLCAIFGGLISGVVAAGLTPLAEFIGSYVTDIKLLELASLDRPLLRELSLVAPGTWNHSMVMGQLGEAAAEAIGANGLLTRVGAYYHDIGKAKKPAYFAENQSDRENRHDKLTPSMSALIIKAHVKDGIEMTTHAHLPQSIIDFIPQHHGTGLIEYFYEKALKEAEEEEVDETHYCYPGPKPQTKEAGILMLADSVEAASRTLSDPSPARIQGMVQKMINKVFASGQLDESELTLKDLHLIAKSFTRVLGGILHRRVEYSEPAEKIKESKEDESEGKETPEHAQSGSHKNAEHNEKKLNGDRNSDETENGKRAHDGTTEKTSPTTGKEALKRLGM